MSAARLRPPSLTSGPRSRVPSGAAAAALVLAFVLGGPARSEELLPLFGGDVRSVTFDPADPLRAFAGTATGQLYRSEDGGETWRTPGHEIAFPGWVVGTLLFDPTEPSRLWAGLWGLWGGGGVAESSDGGETWSWRASEELGQEPVYSLAIAPGKPARIFAGTRGGVWRSQDEGRSWSKVSGGVAGLQQVSSLAIDPRDPERVLAGTWRRAYRSDDGGRSWTGAFDGMVLDTEVFRLIAAPGVPGGLWASTCGWIYRGEEFGGRWIRVQEGLSERRTPAFDALSSQRLLAGTVRGIFVSDDGGASFRPAEAPPLAVHALAHHPRAPQRVLAATEGGGIWRSDDGGSSFVASATGIGALRVAALARTGGTLWAALGWSGPLSALQRSDDGGSTFRPEAVPPAPILSLAGFEGRLYAGTEEGLYVLAGGAWEAVAGRGGARPLKGRVVRLEVERGALVASTAGSRYRVDADGPREIARGEVIDAFQRDGTLATGDPDWPRAEPGPGWVRLRDAGGRVRLELPTLLPEGAVKAVSLWGDRLLIGTAGFGLRALRVDPELRAAAAQTRSSESTIRR